MLGRLARLVVRRRRLVLIASAVLFVAAGAIGGNVAESLSSGGFDDPRAESSRANRLLTDVFGAGQPNLLMVVTAKEGADVDDAAVSARGARLTADLAAEPSISQAASYWSLGNAPPLRSKDGRQALVLATIAGDEDQVMESVKGLSERYRGDQGDVTVLVGGFAEVFSQVQHQIEGDLAKAEIIVLPLTLLALVLVFGSAVAASLPLVIGATSIVGTFLVLRLLSELTQVSIFALNMTTAMGLGLAIDYSLFVVSRYREELANGLPADDAVVRSVETAGRTVVFSAVTVAASLAALLVFPLPFLRSFGYAGIAVVAIAALASIISLPAMLAALGPRIEKLRIVRRPPKPAERGIWHRIAMVVMRRPIPIAAGVLVVLLFLGAPFLRVNTSLPDDRVLPPDATARRATDALRAGFSSFEAGALSVVTTDDVADEDLDRFALALSKVDNVARVDSRTGFFAEGAKLLGPVPASARFADDDGTWVSVVPAVEPLSKAGEQLVHDVRDVDVPFTAAVAGPSAQLVDVKAGLYGRMPLAAVLIGIVTFTVMFMFTGSLLVPAKAVVLNLLSLTATFGAMVWVFQDGNLSGLLGFTATGSIDITTPILMFCVAFGLSMDYEVFLLSRIKEEHDRTGDNVASVAVGLERTGRIVTAAAGLLALVFLAFATSKITFIKLFGLGLAMAVLMDATVIRGLLVPSFMRLAGDANWWAPAPMRRFYERFGLKEAPDPGPSAPSIPLHVIDVVDAAAAQPVPYEVWSTGAQPRRPRPLKAAGR